MNPEAATAPTLADYSLTGVNAERAIACGLAEADWYQCPIPRATMRQLLERRDGPAIADTLLWFALLIATGTAAAATWGSVWFVIPYLIYAVLYASVSDSRWHESSHGTAFKSDWMNNALYEIASFMVMRESTCWRWSHTRHHSDTIIVGRDPEIAVPRPPDIRAITMSFFGLTNYPKYFKHVILHALGRMTPDEKTYIPASEFPKVYLRARIYLLIYGGSIATAILTASWIPVLLMITPHLVGSWLMVVYGLTQHAGLAENVLDHRLNCRTVHLNRIHRYLYWNMNYHIEHHMFPLVPYHALPRLHALIRDDCPSAYPGLIDAWSEILNALRRQCQDPAWHVKRKLPDPVARPASQSPTQLPCVPDAAGWLEIPGAAALAPGDVMRVDHGKSTYAVVRDAMGQFHALDGMCTHGNTHLSDGLVKDGIIECPKHNGRFALADGSPARAPVCRGLATYPIEERSGSWFLNVLLPAGAGARAQQSYQFRVLSNKHVATFIKELQLEPVPGEMPPIYQPGDYFQFEIPPYDAIHFKDFSIPEPFASVWKNQHVLDMVVHNPGGPRRNNYSLASNPLTEPVLRFNIRIATPPPGQDCQPGVGSSYMFNLQTGDIVSAIGPFGDFHIKPTQKEMVYLGGGAGMAPLRSHLSHLLESENSARKISYWYGARSTQELFYHEYFQSLADHHPNFSFHPALSAPLPDEPWTGLTGFIHEVARNQYLASHPHLNAVEFYLCGPPMMVRACKRMLNDLGVADSQIAHDEF